MAKKSMFSQDYFPKTFFRLLGAGNLARYLAHVEHPLLPELQHHLTGVLPNDTSRETLITDTVLPLLENRDLNPRRDQDAVDFQKINELSSTTGKHYLDRELERQKTVVANPPDGLLEYLKTDLPDPHTMALDVLLRWPLLADAVLLTLNVEYQDNWDVFTIPPGHAWQEPLDDHKGAFQAAVRANLAEHVQGCGQATFFDYYEEDDRLLVTVRYAGPLKVEENFDKQEQLTPFYYRQPLPLVLVYNQATGQIKLKTRNRKKSLSRALAVSLISNLLPNPEAVLQHLVQRAVILDRLKTCPSLTVDRATYGLDSARLVSLRFVPNGRAKTICAMSDPDDLTDALQALQLDLSQATIQEATIQFRYPGKKKHGHYKVTLSHNDKVTTNESDQGRMAEAHLQKWGLLSG